MRKYLNVNSLEITLLNVYENNYVIQNKNKFSEESGIILHFHNP